MPYGWTGVNLEIDLSCGEIEKAQADPRSAQMFLGGKGTNAKILWDRVTPEVEPFSPDNLLILGAGVLTGSIAPGANRTCIMYKSPVTNILSYSNLGGFFGPELKHAGYDTIVISGKSPAPVYLWIDDSHVEIRDASHLWGKDTRETERLLREELKNDKAQIVCIGPAGENRVFAASVEHGNGASASRAGVGAVMGDKKLKAIAVYGTKDVNVANIPRLIELGDQILSRTGPLRSTIFEDFGRTLHQWILDIGSYSNFREVVPPPDLQKVLAQVGEKHQHFFDTRRIRETACYNCGLRCKHTYPRSDAAGHSFIKCGSWLWPMGGLNIVDLDYALRFYELANRYGLDTASAVSYVAFAIDLYEKGILTREDTDGMHLEWGNEQIIMSLVEKIARRQGIGDVLANGVYRAARQIGRGAEEYAYHTKKLELLPCWILGPHSTLRQVISDRADLTRIDDTFLTSFWQRPREEREAYIKSGFFSYPKEFEKYFLSGYDLSGKDYEGLCQFVVYDEQTWALADATGLCTFWLVFWWYPPINNRALIADMISCATGLDIDEAEATKIARRTAALVRAYNVREGLRRKDDKPPEMFFRIVPRPPEHKLDPALVNKWVDRFYEIKKYDKEGIPTAETLEELGLDYVRQDLEQRGILPSRISAGTP